MAENEPIEPSSNTVFRLPRSHWHCHLGNFEWDKVTPQSLRSRVRQFVQDVNEGRAPHVLLTGTPGIGKSHIGVGVYRALVTTFGTQLVTWLNVPAFCERVKRTYGADDVDPWADIEDARRLIVLDDLFGRDLTAHERDQILVRLIDTAYQNNAGFFVTMNPSVQELQAKLLPHEISRLLAGSTIIPVVGQKDYRVG